MVNSEFNLKTCSNCKLLKTIQHIHDGEIFSCKGPFEVSTLLYKMTESQTKLISCVYHNIK